MQIHRDVELTDESADRESRLILHLIWHHQA